MKIITLMKRVLVLILIISFIPILSGCWNRRELNTLGILGASAVDLEDGKPKVTFEILKPKHAKGGKGGGGGEEKEEPVKYVQSTGESIFDAFRNATLKFDRKIFISDAKICVFSEEVARKGLIDFIDFLQRDHETRRTAYILIARGSPASEIIGVAGGVEDIPSKYIEDLLDAQKANSKAVPVKIREFLSAYYDKEIQPVIGVIQKTEKVKIGETKKGEKKEYELTDEGSAVFLEDKLVGFLDGIETRALNFVTGKVISGMIVSPTPDGKGVNAVEIIKAGSKNDVELGDGKSKIRVKVTMTGMQGEESGKIDLSEPAVIEKVEKANSQVIKQEVENTIKKVQEEYKSDIFGFGQIVHRKYPYEWKKMQDNWNEIFSRAEVTVEVETKITRTGLVNIPVGKKEEK